MENVVNSEAVVTTKQTKRVDRKMGLEILRIISIFLIICVHLLNGSKFKENSVFKIDRIFLGVLDSFFSTAVNVFVLISGYFLVKSKFKPKKIIQLWCVVVFYNVSSYLVNLACVGSAFKFGDFIATFFPLLSQGYWFFTAYTLLYLSFPFLNKTLNNISKKESIIMIAGICVVTFLTYTTKIDGVIGLNFGYNYLWLCCLYMIGGVLRIYTPKVKLYVWYILYFVAITFNFVGFSFDGFFEVFRLFAHSSEQYTSLIVLLASVSIFMIFLNIDIKSVKARKAISFVSASTFSLYIFDLCHIRDFLHFDVFKVQNFYGTHISVLYILMFAVIIFLMGFVIDLFRRLLFKLVSMLGLIIKNKAKQKKEIEQKIMFSE